ncbi:MAG: hypothetical protein ACI4S9_02045 [Christensenellales bacterium]
MFEKGFAKYARAVSDEYERQWLYKKYRTKTVVSVIFYTLCIILIAAAIASDTNADRIWALPVLTAIILAWTGFAIANICLWISFRRTYNAILTRPAYSGEMPEVTAYRQKVAGDKKSTLKKMWWAWTIFGICVAGFIVCIAMETVRNPDGEEFGVWGGAAFWVLLAGALTVAFAYIINNALKQQQGKTVEQQTESEANTIDRAQGRNHEYKVQTDPNLQTFKYIFPDKHLYDEAEKIRIKHSKTLTTGVLISVAVAVVSVIVLLSSEALFGNNIAGYAMPVAFTLLFGTVIVFSQPQNRRLNALEKKQKAELETNPEYAKNLEWYRLYENFNKFNGKIYLIFIAISVVSGWILAVLFPSSAWSLVMFVPMVVGLVINNKLVKELREKAIPLEREIDMEQLDLHDVRFVAEEQKADEKTHIYYDGDSLMCDGSTGGVTLYLGETLYCMEIDGESCRVVNFSSCQMSVVDVAQDKIPTPQNACDAGLIAKLSEKLANGTCRRIRFVGDDKYDPENGNFRIGNIDDELPVCRIFGNCYVQLSEDGKLLGILCTNICDKEKRVV